MNVIRKRHVTAIVGNGFDLSVLYRYGRELTTAYKSFYYYLRSISFDESNEIFKQMQTSKREGKENWSDFEYALEEVAAKGGLADKVQRDLSGIQSKFSKFLNSVITSDLIDQLDQDAQMSAWAYRMHAEFLSDLSDKQYVDCVFRTRAEHWDHFYFNFFNLNYTPLLDIYLHLDRGQFDPRPYSTVDRNFEFRINPENVKLDTKYPNSETGCSAYIRTDLHHPHGSQNIPRSLLFGTGDVLPDRTFAKHYWAQLEYKYGSILDATELFIVFGSSLGSTDSWWWKSIARRISQPEGRAAELFVYQFDDGSLERGVRHQEIVDEFVRYASSGPGGEAVSVDKLRDRIFSIFYNDPGDLSFLGFKAEKYDPFFRNEGSYSRGSRHWTVGNGRW